MSVRYLCQILNITPEQQAEMREAFELWDTHTWIERPIGGIFRCEVCEKMWSGMMPIVKGIVTGCKARRV